MRSINGRSKLSTRQRIGCLLWLASVLSAIVIVLFLSNLTGELLGKLLILRIVIVFIVGSLLARLIMFLDRHYFSKLYKDSSDS